MDVEGIEREPVGPTVDGDAPGGTNQTASENEARFSRDKANELAAIVNSSTDAILSVSLDGAILTWNPGAETMFGYLAREAIGESIRELLFPVEQLIEFEGTNLIVRGGHFKNFETIRKHRDGTLIDVSASVSPIADKNNCINAISVIYRDVSAKKRTETALAASELFCRTALEASPDCLKIIGFDGRLEYVNQNGVCILEFDDCNLLIGEQWDALWPDAEKLRIRQAVAAAQLGQGSRFTAAAPTAKGTPKIWDVVVTPVFGADGTPLRLLASSRDITQIRRSENSLRKSETRFRGTFENSAVGIAHVSFNGAWLEVNDKLCEIVGYSRVELLGKKFAEITHPDDLEDNLEQIQQLIDDKIDNCSLDKRYMRRDGSIVWVGITASIQRDDTGAPQYLISIIRDISEQKHAQARIQLLMEELNHRSKNLLTVVQAVARQTLKTGDPETFMARLSDRISALAASQDVLVRGQWHGADTAELVRAQFAGFSDAFGTRVLLEGKPATLSSAAAQAIGMALHELATNAAKYGALSNSDGQIKINWGFKGPADDTFFMNWTESGGPEVAPPTRKGFGQTVIVGMVQAAVNGRAEVEYARSGLVWTLEAPTVQTLELN